MAVAANPQETFLWGKGGQKKTPEQVQRDRELAALLMQGGADYSPVQHWAQGLARMSQGIVGGLESRWADEAETAGMAGAVEKYGNPIAQALMGGGGASTGQASFAGAPGAGGASAGGGNSYRDAIASIESAGSGDYNAVGPTHDTLGRALGRYQVMEANIGPWSREALGREITPDEFMASPELQDAIFDHRFGSYVDQYGPQGAAQAWFAGPGGVGKMDRRDVLGTSVSAYTDKFTNAIGGAGGGQPAPVQVASLDPSIGMPAQLPEIGPSGGPQLSAAAPAAPAPAQEIAQALMAPPQGGVAPQQANSILPLLLQASGDPWARKQYGGIIDALMGQQMQQMDPAYQMGLEKSRLELEAMRNPARKRVIVNGRLVYEDTGELVADYSDPNTATVGNTVVDLGTGQPIYQGQPEATSNMKDYDAYAADEQAAGRQPLSRLEYEQAVRKSGATNISMGDGAPGIGKLSTDFGYVLDPATGLPKIDPETGLPQAAAVPGSPAAMAQEQAAAAAAAQSGTQVTSDVEGASTTLATTRSVLDLLDNSDQPTTGTLSRPFAMYSGSPAGKVRSYVNTLQSGVALGAMQRLKEASATGATGFGALSEKELNILISNIGALDPDNTEPEIFRETILRIEDQSKRVIADIKRNVSPERIQELGLQPLMDAFGGNSNVDYNAGAPPEGWGGDPSLWKFLSPEDRALW